MIFKSIFPFDGRELETFESFDKKLIDNKLALSQKAFLSWKKQSFEKRSELLLKVATLLEADKEVFAQTITLEMGKLIGESRAEIEKCALVCRYYAHHAAQFLDNEQISTEFYASYIRHEPLGAIFAVMPWNFPFWQVFRFAAPALMAGNVALVKHAPNVCRCALQIEELFVRAGAEAGVFQTLLLDIADIEQVVASPIVKAVTLTGSERAGASLAALAGAHLKKSVLELGGSDPFIVLADADIEAAARVAVQSRFLNAGQSCIAAKRFIIQKAIYQDFKNLVFKYLEQMKVGNPLEATTTLAPLARPDLAENLANQLKSSLALGASLLYGGGVSACHFEATLIENANTQMPVFQQETFGTLMALCCVQSQEEAVSIANQSLYGLGASVWTKDLERGQMLGYQIESGAVFINTLVRSDVRLPFGGIKNSGYGRELSELGIKEFVNAKTVLVSR